jgi:superoxide reductase
MAQKNGIYRCELCGNMVEMIHVGGGDLVCCGQPMTLLAENTVEASREKHIPVIEKIPGGYKVSVGAVAHPMEEKHYIAWIELLVAAHDGAGVSMHRFCLSPGKAPVAVFEVDAPAVTARAYCNLHGLWKASN